MATSLLPLLFLHLTAVFGSALKRDISPFTSTVATASITVNPSAQISAYNAGLSLSGSPPDDGNVTADTIRLVGWNGCSDMPGVSNAEAQIYSGWQQAQKIMALEALKDGTVDFNTAGGRSKFDLLIPRTVGDLILFILSSGLFGRCWPQCSSSRRHERYLQELRYLDARLVAIWMEDSGNMRRSRSNVYVRDKSNQHNRVYQQPRCRERAGSYQLLPEILHYAVTQLRHRCQPELASFSKIRHESVLGNPM